MLCISSLCHSTVFLPAAFGVPLSVICTWASFEHWLPSFKLLTSWIFDLSLLYATPSDFSSAWLCSLVGSFPFFLFCFSHLPLLPHAIPPGSFPWKSLGALFSFVPCILSFMFFVQFVLPWSHLSPQVQLSFSSLFIRLLILAFAMCWWSIQFSIQFNLFPSKFKKIQSIHYKKFSWQCSIKHCLLRNMQHK